MTKLIRGLYNIQPHQRGGIITIGNFDGVHRGHQTLIAKVILKARSLNLPSTLITFEPQPLEFFNEIKVPRLTRFREKFIALRRTGIENVLVLQFNQTLATFTPEEFIKKVLVEGLAVEHVIVGDDFRFGYKRTGDFAFLKAAGIKFGFTVENMECMTFEDKRVSSTQIRQALLSDKHNLAANLLGRPYSMMGRVVHGDKLGRKLGFPTANIYLHRTVAPVQGIYTVKMHGIDNKPLPGVANVGIRPTIGGTRALLEVYLFDFDRDIYGKAVTVEFCKKIRDEEHYPNLELLREAIANDVAVGKSFFHDINLGSSNDEE